MVENGPRERLLFFGVESLSDAELIAVLLGTGTTRDPVSVLAVRLLAQFGTLADLANATNSELSSVRGVGPAKLARLVAAGELGRRMVRSSSDRKTNQPIRHSLDIANELVAEFQNETTEHFLAIAVDTKLRPIKRVVVAKGGRHGALVDVCALFRQAILASAHAIIVAHNHPSGDPRPSPSDTALTHALAQAGQLLELPLLDHLILGSGRYFSFADEGLLTPQTPRALLPSLKFSE
ncbi:MAG: DNA repair protein RadC [Polyangiales bacterium]